MRRIILICIIALFISSMLIMVCGCKPKVTKTNYNLNVNWSSLTNEGIQSEPEQEEVSDENRSVNKFNIMRGNQDKFHRIIVKFKKQYEVRDINASRAEYKKFEKYGKFKAITKRGSKLNFGVVEPENTNSIDWEEIIRYYDSLPEVEYAEPDYKVEPFFTPNDPEYTNQWHFSQLGMESVWDTTMGDASVKVAVIDSGIAYTDDPDNPDDNGLAPDLADTAFDTDNAYDYVDEDNIAYDDLQHGTHVAGTIAQSTNNSIGCAGMSPNVTILPLKIFSGKLDTTKQGNNVAITAQAIEDASDAGADIINMSFGNLVYNQIIEDACNYAYSQGSTLFAGTGNFSAMTGFVSYPAGCENVIAVGAVDYAKNLAPYSDYGNDDYNNPDNTGVDIVAPGGDVDADLNGDSNPDGVLQQTIIGYQNSGGTEYIDYTFDYIYMNGTSMATPHASALGALLKSAYPNLSPKQIKQIIVNSAEDLGSTGYDEQYGYGLINPVDAFDVAENGIQNTDSVDGVLIDDELVTYTFDVYKGDIEITFTPSGELTVELYSPAGELIGSSLTGELTHTITDASGVYSIRVKNTPISE